MSSLPTGGEAADGGKKNERQRIAVLYPQLSDQPTMEEKESSQELDLVADSLTGLGHTVARIPVSLDLARVTAELRQFGPDAVFNLVDAIESNGKIHYIAAALLEHLGLPFTGSPTDDLYLTTHKLLVKRLLTLYGLPTPAWIDRTEASDFVPGSRYLLIPVSEDASIGLESDAVFAVDDLEDFRRLLREKRAETGREYFGSRLIVGREFWVSLIGQGAELRALPPAEIYFSEEPIHNPLHIIGYRAKWEADSFEYTHLRARFDFEGEDLALVEQLKNLALSACQALGIGRYLRMDFRVDEQGQPWILEINTNPFLLFHHGGFIDAAAHAGMEPADVFRELLDMAGQQH
jgi:D-alanine-D-alanine ligase